ncbi:MAG: hypothetical protein ACI9SE_002666 [Neolewinella sp.]|jgi:hypothetical protein
MATKTPTSTKVNTFHPKCSLWKAGEERIHALRHWRKHLCAGGKC